MSEEEGKLAKSYSNYLIRESIAHAYAYFERLKKEHAKLEILEAKRAATEQKYEARIQAVTSANPSEKELVQIEKLSNQFKDSVNVSIPKEFTIK